MGTVQIRYGVLGRVTAWHGDQELDLGWARQRAVLAVLLLDMNRPVSPAAIAAEVWGERSPRNARRTVQTNISRLRRALAPRQLPGHRRDVLTTTDAGYLLRGNAGQLDAARFDDHLGRAERFRHAGELPAAIAEIDVALRLWRGEPFCGLTGPRIEAERIRWDERHLAGIELRAAIEVDGGHHAGVLAELARLVDEFPLRERIRELLMLALYRSGRQAEALRHYHDVRQRLADELGVDPSRSLQRIYHQILAAGNTSDVADPWHSARPARPRNRHNGTVTDLATRYHAYLAALNERRLGDLDDLVQDELTYNGEPRTRQQYRDMIAADIAAIPDLFFDAEIIVVDDDRVACRIAFRCTPVSEFLGFTPNGAQLSFTEHVFYEFREGRIAAVVSMIDRWSIAAQLREGQAISGS